MVKLGLIQIWLMTFKTKLTNFIQRNLIINNPGSNFLYVAHSFHPSGFGKLWSIPDEVKVPGFCPCMAPCRCSSNSELSNVHRCSSKYWWRRSVRRGSHKSNRIIGKTMENEVAPWIASGSADHTLLSWAGAILVYSDTMGVIWHIKIYHQGWTAQYHCLDLRGI